MCDEVKPVQLARILVLDGGGMRGLATIRMLKELMTKIDPFKDDDELFPWKHFDLIVGTSTGGLLAMIFGRLRLSIAKARDLYRRLGQDIFGPRARRNILYQLLNGHKLTDTGLVKILTDVVGDMPMLDDRHDACKVFVTSTLLSSSTTHRIRTYQPSWKLGPSHGWRVSEAARATTAASTYFRPFALETKKGTQYWVDAAANLYNNPSQLALHEAYRLFPGRKIVLVSLGTGRKPPVGHAAAVAPSVKGIAGALLYIKRESRAPWSGIKQYLGIVRKLVSAATSTEQVHHFMNTIVSLTTHDRFQYFRFDPRSGGQYKIDACAEWQLADIRKAADDYLKDHDVQSDLLLCAASLKLVRLDVHDLIAAAPKVHNPSPYASPDHSKALASLFKLEYNRGQIVNALTSCIDDILSDLHPTVEHSELFASELLDLSRTDKARRVLDALEDCGPEETFVKDVDRVLHEHPELSVLLQH